MAEIENLDPVDANNTARFPENMAPSAVNNGARALEGLLARWFQDTNGSITASGSSNAFAVTSKRTIAALSDALRMSFKANHSITGSATLNLNGIGATAIKRWNGSATAQGDIVSGQIVDLVYSSSLAAWLMMSVPAALIASTHADFSENAAPGDPAANVARVYAKDDGTVTRLAYRDSAGTETLLQRLPARAYDEYSDTTALTDVIPNDGTTPQITEGTEILSVAITLRRADSRVRARFVAGNFDTTNETNDDGMAALFVTGTANALNSCISEGDTGANNNSIACEIEHAPGSVGPHTYSVRAGPATGGSVAFGGNGSKATLVVEEVFV